MNTNDYINLITDLNQCLTSNPTSLLALTVAWLDPLAVLEDLDELQHDDLSDYYYSGDEMGAALSVSRECFPGIYAEAISKIRDGDGYQTVATFVSEAITDQTGLPVNEYEEPSAYAYGIPLPYYGFDLDEMNFDENYPGVANLLHIFGAQTDDNSGIYTSIDLPNDIWDIANVVQWSLWSERDNPLHKDIMWAIAYCFSNSGNSSVLCGIEIPKSSTNLMPQTSIAFDKAYTIGKIIAADLEEHSDERYRQVSWLMKWLFSCSNNSCVDWTAEDMYSVEPLAWEPDDVAFAIELISEAEIIMSDVQAGLEWVRSEPVVLLALWYNVRQIDRALEEHPESEERINLTWPDLSHDNATQVKYLLNEWECLPVQSG